MTLIVCAVALVIIKYPWILGVALGLYAARLALRFFAGWARGQRLAREALVQRCVAQHDAITRGDVSGVYGDYPPS